MPVKVNSEDKNSFFRKFSEAIFYGNFFYGICSVSQVIESTLQHNLPVNNYWLYTVTFLATLLFYNYPYARNYSHASDNPRSNWYRRHYAFVRRNQLVFGFIIFVLGLQFFIKYYQNIFKMETSNWFQLLVFPAVSALYYGSNVFSRRFNLRQIGWLKPFLIGFSWAGIIVVYPVLFYNIQNNINTHFSFFHYLLFMKNFMFISLLAIMFDIKDYAADSRKNLSTMVVKIGLRKTIFYVLIPLTLLGLLTFITYSTTHQFGIIKMILIMIPFICLLVVVNSLKKRRSLMYYLVVIDGLMVLKAFFGILAFSF